MPGKNDIMKTDVAKLLEFAIKINGIKKKKYYIKGICTLVRERWQGLGKEQGFSEKGKCR